MTALQPAASLAGVEAALSRIDLSCDRLGKRLGVTGEAVRLWRRGKQRMSGRHAEQVDGMFGVPRHLLRPDLFDPPQELESTPGSGEPPHPLPLRGAA